jgi:hypothetical protein
MIIAVMRTLARSAERSMSIRNVPKLAAIASAPATPTAAASVGVAQPR